MAKKLDTQEVAADKAKAMREYNAANQAAVDRIAALRAARLARDAKAVPAAKKVKKPSKKGEVGA